MVKGVQGAAGRRAAPPGGSSPAQQQQQAKAKGGGSSAGHVSYTVVRGGEEVGVVTQAARGGAGGSEQQPPPQQQQEGGQLQGGKEAPKGKKQAAQQQQQEQQQQKQKQPQQQGEGGCPLVCPFPGCPRSSPSEQGLQTVRTAHLPAGMQQGAGHMGAFASAQVGWAGVCVRACVCVCVCVRVRVWVFVRVCVCVRSWGILRRCTPLVLTHRPHTPALHPLLQALEGHVRSTHSVELMLGAQQFVAHTHPRPVPTAAGAGGPCALRAQRGADAGRAAVCGARARAGQHWPAGVPGARAGAHAAVAGGAAGRCQGSGSRRPPEHGR